MDRETVALTGVQETTLATLYGKALESRRPDSVLQDTAADAALQGIDYDFARLRVRRSDQRSLVVRAKAYDHWAAKFLADHPQATVLHLGCGLDTRVYRVDPPPSVRWYDVDLPDVIELRRRLFPARDGMQMVGISITDSRLLDGISGDTPVLMVAEGVTPYLRESDGIAMLRRVVTHFPSGQLLFDAYGRRGVWLLQRYGCVKASGAKLDWSIDDPHELEGAVPGLRLRNELCYSDAPGLELHLSSWTRAGLRMIYRVPRLRRLGRPLRYEFN